MKKFILIVTIVVVLFFICDILYYRLGIYIDLDPKKEITTFMTTDDDIIYIEKNGKKEPFEIKGVNMGVGIPGKWATDYAIDEETYLRWFKQIQEMGANTLRVYTILHDDFYNAFYKYNVDNEEPLYLIHGVWVNDYVQNSHRDAFDNEFRQQLIDDCRTVVDILHGNKKLSLGYGLGSGSYRKDVSEWVIGYIIGVEWEDVTVTYTNEKYPERNQYKGNYMYTSEDASPFEAMLCEVGDKIIEYESKRYKQQRLIAFSNWPTTDPFTYPALITMYFMKCAQVDVEHIKTTNNFVSGQFASYHVYPYYPDYLAYLPIAEEYDSAEDMQDAANNINPDILERLEDIEENYQGDYSAKKAIESLFDGNYTDSSGRTNTYYAYLRMLIKHHTMPVVISEFGVSTGRGMAQRDLNTNRNQGNMTEQEQGEALIECWEDIMNAGCAGGCVFTWQDEWFKRTWNTMHAVDLDKTPYWSDYQTNEQYFGLLAFDPGEEEGVCYVDGNIEEWDEKDLVSSRENMDISMKYDEKFIYFLVRKDKYDPDKDILYIPIDTTPKSGSTYCNNYDILFERESDFVIVLDGKENSRILVQERSEVLRAMFSHEVYNEDAFINPVDKNSSEFKKINLLLQTAVPLLSGNWNATSEIYETGELTYGNANPDSDNFNSLADFIVSGDYIEIRIPWQLLNFANPSEMQIHDDYYENYGVEYLTIDEMYVGIGSDAQKEYRIPMESFPLEGWGKHVTYHERLKESYYILKDYWTSSEYVGINP